MGDFKLFSLTRFLKFLFPGSVLQKYHMPCYSNPEATVQRCSWEKVFWKYTANLQENTHAEVQFQ